MVVTLEPERARREIVEFGRRMRSLRLIVATEGNLSTRVGPDLVLTTPSGRDKGELTEQELVLVDSQGRSTGSGRPSTEIEMHLAVYAERDDVGAIVHGHPPYATAFAAAGRALDLCLLPEVVLALGRVPLTEYGTPSTPEVPAAVRAAIREHDAMLLQNHGVVAVGRDLRDAFYKLETVEQLATVTLLAELLGGARPLNEHQVKRLMEVRGVYGLDGAVSACRPAAASVASSEDTAAGRSDEEGRARRLVAEEIRRVLER